MIDSFGIYRKAEQLVQKSATNNVLQIASDLGVKLYYGNYDNLLGMYTCKWKHRFIFLNNKLENYMLQMVLAHEIGHDIFHRDLANDGLKEFALFNLKNITEYEANAFAAHILLKNEEVLTLVRDGYDVAQIASILNSHINLLLIKMQEMNKMGLDFNIPFSPRSNFFKDIPAK
ncbi:ImmA/IrrE family metallo-endopeptidase [Sedimentibacter sp.]|uniref:ImmA/IrrE family metallo-endopeptidase n=1 Tax=Sedimentibacter sp. TaxID=1960295 RepID=UPI00289DA224|nr:ImmA/IrrE family metallo-endopeptidase [Sedimentibacter sp.]